MKTKSISKQHFLKLILFYLSVFSFNNILAQNQQMERMIKDSTAAKKTVMIDEDEIAHPFFSHMGMPEAPGVFSLRLSALSTQMDGKYKGDFAFHTEIGISKLVGIHIRNDQFLENTHTEVMFQFGIIKSKDGMSGFSPIIEFEIPTKKGANRINTLVGFSTALVKSSFEINQVIHYNPREDMLDGSIAFVYRIRKGLFFVTEALGEKMTDAPLALNLVGGLKLKINNYLLIGLGYRQSVTGNMDFKNQFIFQPDMEYKKK